MLLSHSGTIIRPRLLLISSFRTENEFREIINGVVETAHTKKGQKGKERSDDMSDRGSIPSAGQWCTDSAMGSEFTALDRVQKLPLS